jgi:hypothetical protein
MRIICAKFENLKKVKSFKFHPQNREVEEAKVKKLRQTLFKDGKWQTLAAVIVNVTTMNILDGQHRWTLYLQLVEEGLIDPNVTPLWIEYVEMNPQEEHAYITSLQEANHWDNEEFCESYVKGGDTNYITAKEFCDSHPLCNHVNKAGKVSRRAYRLANIMLTGDRNEKHLRNGQLVLSKEDVQEGDAIHNEIQKILTALKIESTIGRSGLEGLASSWRVFRKNGHPMKAWIKELSKKKYEGGPKYYNKTWGVETWNEFLKPAAYELLMMSMEA